MRSRKHLPLIALIGLAACSGQTHQMAQAPLAADLVLIGGIIRTVDAQGRVASAMAVRDGKIVYVGNDTGARAFVAAGTEVRQLEGRAVLPGFTDSHAHLPYGGAGLLGLSLVEASSAKDAVAMVKAYADAHPDLTAIVGSGWELSLFEGGNPDKALLDAVVADRPVFLVAADGHNGWVNSKALEMAGITAATVDPPNGRVERDGDGNPSGTLRESAQGLVEHVFPKPAVEQVVKNTEAGIQYQLGHGITATIDAAIMADNMEKAYLRLSAQPDLPQRVRLSLLAADEMVTSKVTTGNVAQTLAVLEARRQQFREASLGRVDAESVKIFVDGVPENYTAAMLEPYIGTPLGDAHRGAINLTEEALDTYLVALDAANFQVHIHAIGDRAVRVSLDAVEEAVAANGPKDRRHHVSHLEFVQPVDIARFGPLGTTANLQTLWHYEDEYIADLTKPFVREDLHRWLYPAKSFVSAGGRIVWGSDWPVSSSDAFDSLEVAVTRRGAHGEDAPALVPEEALSIDEMIRALTINGAYLMGQDDIRGSLEVGKLADFFIASDDPYSVPMADLSDITVLETFIDGKSVFKR